MTPIEAIRLCRLVKACCPQQQIDEYTPDAWAVLLDDLRAEDCTEAVKNLARRQPFVAPSEIRSEVTRIRNERVERVKFPEPPSDLPDNPLAYKEWLVSTTRRIANGWVPEEPQQLKPRDMRALPEFPRPEGDAA